TVSSSFFGCTTALLLSVLGRKTHEVLLAAYLIEVILMLAYPIARGVEGAVVGKTVVSSALVWSNPFAVLFSPYIRGPTGMDDVGWYLTLMFGGGFVLTVAGVWRVRRGAVRVA